MRRIAIALAALASAAIPTTQTWARNAISAPKSAVRVIDGDTIEIEGKTLDIYGMDAPELGQRCLHNNSLWSCGFDAAFALQRLVGDGEGVIRCSYWGAKPGAGPRKTAVCDIAGRDVARTMIIKGFAVAAPGAFPIYPDTQVNAKKTGLGIWRGPFILPWNWREGVRLAEETAAEDTGCSVKSVIGRDGKRTHFVPTDKEYKETLVDAKGGGRCFDSDEEARLAEAPPPPPTRKKRPAKRPKQRTRAK